MEEKQDSEKPLRVLIVEDREDDALLMIDHLESNGVVCDWQRVDTEEAMLKAIEKQIGRASCRERV